MGYIIYINIYIYYYILYKILSGFFRQFNFCSTVICSTVPLFQKTGPKTGHRKTAYVLKNTPVFGPENLLPRRKCRTFAPSIERHTYLSSCGHNCRLMRKEKTQGTMAIKVKAIERNVSFTKGEEKWAYVLQADLYSKLTADKVIQEAALRSGISRGSINAAWDAIGEVIKAWATEGHSVAVPGLGSGAPSFQ